MHMKGCWETVYKRFESYILIISNFYLTHVTRVVDESNKKGDS